MMFRDSVITLREINFYAKKENAPLTEQVRDIVYSNFTDEHDEEDAMSNIREDIEEADLEPLTQEQTKCVLTWYFVTMLLSGHVQEEFFRV